MKIIKIVHDGELSKDQLSASEQISQFDITSFLESNYEKIVQISEDIPVTQPPRRKISTGEEVAFFLKSLGQSFLVIPDSTRDPLDKARISRMESELQRMAAREKRLISATVKRMLAALNESPINVKYLTLSAAKQDFPLTKNLAIGSYTLHPREPRMLTRLANFHKNLAIEKDDELVMLLGKMGAETVEIIHSSEENNRGKLQSQTEALKIDASLSMNFSSTLTNEQHLVVTFEGQPAEIPEDLLFSSIWFSDDSRLISIFENRRSSKNKIVEYFLTNTYGDSFDFDFEIAAKFLKISSDLRAEYQVVKNQSRKFKVKFGSKKQKLQG